MCCRRNWSPGFSQRKRRAARADKELKAAKRQRAEAERLAIEARQALGFKLGHQKMRQGIRDHLLPLAAWCREYETLREETRETFGVQLPDLPRVVLSERDIQELCATIFLQNRLGSSLLTADDRAEETMPVWHRPKRARLRRGAQHHGGGRHRVAELRAAAPSRPIGVCSPSHRRHNGGSETPQK